MVVFLGLRKGQGAGLSALPVDPTALAPPGARARTGGGSPMSRPSGSRHSVQASRSREIKPHKVRYYLERRDAEFEPKMAEVLCVYREVQVLEKAAAKAGEIEQSGRDRLLRREAWNPGHRQ